MGRLRDALFRFTAGEATPKAGAALSPEYQRRYGMRADEWLMHLYAELTERESHWMGVRALKNPLDAWVYQELLHEVQPEIVVELGSAFGGSTLFLCHMLDLLGLDGAVVSVDHAHSEFRAEHDRIVKVTGDTRDREVITRVHELCAGKRGFVIHDASHDADVVLEDLRSYSPLVAPGSYLIVEDGVRDFLAGRPGPVMAIDRFLEEAPEFEIDESRERFLLTYNPKGFLKRS